MATLLLTAVGTAIGGPLGGAIGAFVGQQADSFIIGIGTSEGPRLKELSVTTSSYGQPMPRHFGRMRTAGAVIWSTELIETTSKEGGGKGSPSTKTYSYSASFAVSLSSTPINRVGRIWADGNLLRGAAGDLKVEGEMRTYLGTGDQPIDPVIAADQGGQSPAFRDCAYVVFENLQLADFGNRIPALTFEIFGVQDSSVSLDQLVPLGASTSSDMVLENALGFSDEGGPIGSSLAAIDRVFPLNCVTAENGLQLSSRSSMPSDIPVLSEQLSNQDSEDADELHTRRGDTLDFEPLALRYYDEDRDYQPGVQRAVGLRPEGRETVVDLPATMTAQGAKRLANSNAHRARWKDESVVWRIGTLDPQIRPGSVVRLPQTSGFWVVQNWEWYDKGIELGLVRMAPDLEVESTSVPGSANAPADLEITETHLWFFEVPPENASQPNTPILLAAASSSGAGWRGASLFADSAGTLSDVGSTGSSRAAAGHLVSQLGGSVGALLEPNASIEVDLVAGDLTIPSTDVTGIANGANRLMVGGEILQFLTAEKLSGYRWRLSGILRGRAGTEDASLVGHDAGTTIALIDDRLVGLNSLGLSADSLSQLAAIGTADAEPVTAQLQNSGLSRRPPMPVHHDLTINDDGSWSLCWTRRARGQWQWTDATEVPLVEEQESYMVGFGPCDMPHAAWTTSAPMLTISLAERDDLAAEHGAGELWVRQLGTFGQSAALLLASIP